MSGLKTITIRNLALATRDVQLVVRVLPYVLLHFQSCHAERGAAASSCNGGDHAASSSVVPSPVNPRAENKQFETLQRQFDNASEFRPCVVMSTTRHSCFSCSPPGKHLRNHVEEIQQKILSVVDSHVMRHVSDWKPPPQIPSAGFKVRRSRLTNDERRLNRCYISGVVRF